MKKRISFILAAIMLLAVMIPAIPVSAATTNTFNISNYDGTSEFLLTTPEDFLNFYDAVYGQGKDFAGKTVTMADDITLNDKTGYENWGTTAPAVKLTAVGSSPVYFKGTFDGGNHTITGAYSNKVPGSHWTGGVALFPFVNGTVTIQNLTLDGFYFASDATYAHPDGGATVGSVGSLVGHVQQGKLTIKNCTVLNGVLAGDADDNVGGFIGNAVGTFLTVEDSVLKSTAVSGEGIVGGAVGIITSLNGTATGDQPIIFKNSSVENTVTVDGGTMGAYAGKIANNAAIGGETQYAPNSGYWTNFFIGTVSFMAKNTTKSLSPVGAYEIGEAAKNNGYHFRMSTELGNNRTSLTSVSAINKDVLEMGLCGTTYTVTWSVNGSTTEELYAEGTIPAFKGSTDKAAEGNTAYTFKGWDAELAAVTADVTYTAQYDEKTAYVITWVVDGQEYTETYAEGETPTFKGNTDKANEGDTYYYFKGWDKEIVAVTGAATYTAEYDSKTKYTVTWDVNGNTTTDKVFEGEVPVFNGNTDKASEGNTAYIFKGWDKEVVAVTGDVTYTAQYDAKTQYTVTWSVNGKDITETYLEGEVPTFKGSASKPADAENTYTFKGWDKEVVAVTGDVTYTAQFEAKSKNSAPATPNTSDDTTAPADSTEVITPATTEAPTEKKGCKGTISIGLVTVAMLGTAVAFVSRKKED